MSTNSLYRNQLNNFLNLFFAFYDKSISEGLTSVMIVDRESNEPLSPINLSAILFEDDKYLRSGKGNISAILNQKLNNSLTRSYSIFLDLVGISVDYKNINTHGAKELLPEDFRRELIDNQKLKEYVDRLKDEIRIAAENGDSSLIKPNLSDADLNLAILGHQGIETGALYSPVASLISYGIGYRLPTEFLIKRIANIKKDDFGTMDHLIRLNQIGSSNLDEKTIIPVFLGKTREEIMNEFRFIKSRFGGCPFVHNANEESKIHAEEINPKFEDLRIREGLTNHLDKFVVDMLEPFYSFHSDRGKLMYFSNWDRLMLSRRAMELDKELFVERHGEESYQKEMGKILIENEANHGENENR
jgi:hypothetical protein